MYPTFLKQASQEKGKSEVSSNEDVDRTSEPFESVVSQLNEVTISENSSVASPPVNSAAGDQVPDIDKRIRALKKKVFLKLAACHLKSELCM